MRILYSPQVSDNDKIVYAFDDEVVTATINGITDIFDFRSFPDGMASSEDIETDLPINPIVFVRKEQGILSITLLQYVDSNAERSELFPEWIEV